MRLHALDIGIILGYFLTVILVGLWVSRRGAKDLEAYFLGGKTLPWYMLGVSDASGMFDISGTMWLVYVLFIYGLKSIWLPWVWPTFNQIFLMMFMSAWLRRSNVLTGAQWMQTRFGRGPGRNLAHLSVVFFALVNVIGLLAYAFKGIGKFAVGDAAVAFRRAALRRLRACIQRRQHLRASSCMGLTSLYAIKGGMVSVVITEVMQFTILTLTALTIGVIAIVKVSPDDDRPQHPGRLDEPVFRLETGPELGRDPEHGERGHQGGRQRVLHDHLRPDVLQGRAGEPGRSRAELRHAAHPRHAQSPRGLADERHGDRGAHVPALHDDRRHHGAGPGLLHAAIQAQGKPDFEKVLPMVLSEPVRRAWSASCWRACCAAFMSNFAATLNAAPAYVVNDIYKRFINPKAGGKKEVTLSRIVSLVFLAVGISSAC